MTSEPRKPLSTWWTGQIGYTITLLMAAVALSFDYSFWTGCFISPALYTEGHERLPFQSRVLTAWMMRPLAHSHLLNSIAHVSDRNIPAFAQGPYFLAMAVVVFFSLVIATLACRAILLHYTHARTFSSWMSLLVIYCSYFNLVLGFGVHTQPYDVPALALMMIGVWLIVTDRLWWLMLLVLLSSFNRETTVFLPLFLVLHWWFSDGRSRASRVLGLAALQVVLIFAVRAFLAHLFINSPRGDAPYGGILSVHLLPNLHQIFKPQLWPLMFSTFGFTLPVLFLDFHSVPDRAFAKATLCVFFLWIAIVLLVGVFSEVRLYNEFSAFIVPCLALIAWSHWQRHTATTCEYRIADAPI